jgi:hypothetical protein
MFSSASLTACELRGARLVLRSPSSDTSPVLPHDATLAKVMGDLKTMQHLRFARPAFPLALLPILTLDSMWTQAHGQRRHRMECRRRGGTASGKREGQRCVMCCFASDAHFSYISPPFCVAAGRACLMYVYEPAPSAAGDVNAPLIGISGFPFVGTPEYYQEYFASLAPASATKAPAPAPAPAASSLPASSAAASSSPSSSSSSSAPDSKAAAPTRMGEFGIILHHTHWRSAYGTEGMWRVSLRAEVATD